jgi:hypothetical protein
MARTTQTLLVTTPDEKQNYLLCVHSLQGTTLVHERFSGLSHQVQVQLPCRVRVYRDKLDTRGIHTTLAQQLQYDFHQEADVRNARGYQAKLGNGSVVKVRAQKRFKPLGKAPFTPVYPGKVAPMSNVGSHWTTFTGDEMPAQHYFEGIASIPLRQETCQGWMRWCFETLNQNHYQYETKDVEKWDFTKKLRVFCHAIRYLPVLLGDTLDDADVWTIAFLSAELCRSQNDCEDLAGLCLRLCLMASKVEGDEWYVHICREVTSRYTAVQLLTGVRFEASWNPRTMGIHTQTWLKPNSAKDPVVVLECMSNVAPILGDYDDDWLEPDKPHQVKDMVEQQIWANVYSMHIAYGPNRGEYRPTKNVTSLEWASHAFKFMGKGPSDEIRKAFSPFDLDVVNYELPKAFFKPWVVGQQCKTPLVLADNGTFEVAEGVRVQTL